MISGRKAFFSAVVTSALNAMGIFVGFALQALLSKKFGTKASMDAYIVAGTLPYFIPVVFVVAFHSSFIPLFHEYQKEAGEEKAWEMGQMFFLGFTVLLCLISVSGYSLIPFLIGLIAPGFTGETFDVTVNLSRIMFPLLLFSGVTGMLNSLENAVFSFSRPAAAPLLNMIFNILVVWFFEPSLGIYSAAVGALVGGIAQTMFMLPVLFRRNTFRLRFDFGHPKLKKCFYLMSPLLIAQLFGKSEQLIDRFIASMLPTGSISFLSYAYRLTNNFVNLIGTSISVVTLPLLSGMIGDSKKMSNTVSSVVELWLILVTPLIFSLLLLRVPVIQFLYQRGEFTYASTINTASALLAYSGVFLITMGVGGTTLYAMQKTKFMLYLCVVMAFCNAAVAIVVTKYFGFRGPAVAYSVKIILSNVVCFAYLHSHLDIKLRKTIIAQVVKVLFANTLSVLFVNRLFGSIHLICAGISINALMRLSYISIAFASYMFIYFLIMMLINRHSMIDIYRLVKKPDKETA